MKNLNRENTRLWFLNDEGLYNYLLSFMDLKKPLAKYKRENPYGLRLPDGTKATQKGFMDVIESERG